MLSHETASQYPVGFSAGLFRIVRPGVEVAYPDGAKLTAVKHQGPTVLLVAPEALGGAGAVLLIAAGVLVRRRLRRRAARLRAPATHGHGAGGHDDEGP